MYILWTGHRVHTWRSMQCCLFRKQRSITAGTIFEQNHIPLTVWFLMIFLVSQDKGGNQQESAPKMMSIECLIQSKRPDEAERMVYSVFEQINNLVRLHLISPD